MTDGRKKQAQGIVKAIHKLQYKLDTLEQAMIRISTGEIPMTDDQFDRFCADNQQLFEVFNQQVTYAKHNLQ